MTPDELQTLVVRISEQVRTPVDYVSLIAHLLTDVPRDVLSAYRSTALAGGDDAMVETAIRLAGVIETAMRGVDAVRRDAQRRLVDEMADAAEQHANRKR